MVLTSSRQRSYARNNGLLPLKTTLQTYSGEKSGLVDFCAAWCGPCRMAAPEVARTAAETAGHAIVLNVDTERYPELAARYNVRGIPNFAVFSNGRLQFQQAGLVNHDQLKQWVQAA